MKGTLAFLSLALLVLGGCASAPPAGDSERVIASGTEVAAAVVLCKTTVQELQQRLGKPSRDGLLGRARVITWIVEWDPLIRYLGVLSDDAGIVVDMYWNVPSEVPWTPVNRCK